MAPFHFRYRLNGAAPRLERLPFNKAETLTAGDMVHLDAGGVALAATGDGNLLGAAHETKDGTGPTKFIQVITDADAVYAVTDGNSRRAGDSVDLTGATGTPAVAEGPNGDFAVVCDSSDTDETLVRISVGRHAYDRRSGGELNAALARAVVQLYKKYVGRGPMKAEAFVRNNVIVVLMQHLMTTAERTLASNGQRDAVFGMRRQLQQIMRPDLARIDR